MEDREEIKQRLEKEGFTVSSYRDGKMVEHKKIHEPFELIDQRLAELGKEGWIPWSEKQSQIPGDNRTSVTVRLWRLVTMVALCLFLAGCIPALQVSQVPMTIQGKQVVYVAAAWHNGQGVNACALDRYINGELVAHDMLSNNGLAEMLLPTIVNAVAPVATSVGPYIK